MQSCSQVSGESGGLYGATGKILKCELRDRAARTDKRGLGAAMTRAVGVEPGRLPSHKGKSGAQSAAIARYTPDLPESSGCSSLALRTV